MKSFIFFLNSLFVIFSGMIIGMTIFSENVYAVGIQPGLPYETIVYEPGLHKEYSYNLNNANKIHSYVTGDLLQYVQLIDSDPDSGPRTIVVKIDFPETLEPGSYTIYVGGTEISENQGTVGGLASIRTRIPVLVLYPGKYPVISGLSVDNVNVNEKSNVVVSVHNFGEETIDSITATVEIFDMNNNTITELTTNTDSVSANEDAVLKTVLDTSIYGLEPGLYRAEASIVYDGIIYNQTVQKEFMIGKLSVNIIDSTKQVFINSTNKFYILLESDWSGEINDVYAKIYMPNKVVLKTPTVDLIRPPNDQRIYKAQAKLETYWETNDLLVGDYDVQIELYYKDIVDTQHVNVSVTEGQAPVIEKPTNIIFSITENKLILFNNTISLTLALMILLAMIVTLNIGYFFIRKKNNNTKEKLNEISNANNKNNVENNTINRNNTIKPPKP